MKAPWITFRPEIKVLDCTVRDGGLINEHMFEDGLVKAVYEACVEAGVDYMELGYKNSKRIFAPSKNGPWKFCDEDDLRRIVGDNPTTLKLSAMADAEKFYAAHTNRFAVPAKAGVRYVSFPFKGYAATNDIADTDVSAW